MKNIRSANGAAFVELAIAMPVLVAVLVGIADLARVMYYSIEVTAAARAGAQYASLSNGHATLTANIQAAAQSAAPNIGTVTVTPGSPVCVCASDDGSGQPWSSVSCSSTCATGHMMETVTVTVTRYFTPISRFPGISRTLQLTRSVTMRVSL